MFPLCCRISVILEASLRQSASLTAPSSEGALGVQQLLDSKIDILAYTAKITVDIHVANPNHLKLHIVQVRCSGGIFFCLSSLIMSASVQFNNQPCFCTVKIHNIITDCFLTLKANRILSQIFIPQFSFPWCHIFTKSSCQRDVFLVILLHTAKKLLIVVMVPFSTLASIMNSPVWL